MRWPNVPAPRGPWQRCGGRWARSQGVGFDGASLYSTELLIVVTTVGYRPALVTCLALGLLAGFGGISAVCAVQLVVGRVRRRPWPPRTGRVEDGEGIEHASSKQAAWGGALAKAVEATPAKRDCSFGCSCNLA